LKQLGGLLDERGWTRERCLALYRFIEWALRPRSEEMFEEYKKWMRKEEEKKMYVTVAEEIGIEKGMAIGLEKGKEETRREAALRMLDKGLEPSLIAECVDLTEEEVLRLREERS
jgi:predicted transposase/invertase (TIGR01784 family)